MLGAAILWPYRADDLSPGSLRDIINPIVQAEQAISEGQFPIRVAPGHLHGTRYPLFQFYGNAPFTACGLVLHFFNVTPYTAWRIIVLLTAACGGYFTSRSAYQLTRHVPASVVAGVLFMAAPYALMDLYQRSAYSEYTALNVFPAALFFTLRTLQVRGRSVRSIIACAVAWTLVGLSHNITYLYGVVFCGLFVLSYGSALLRRGRWARLLGAGLLHAALIAWYVVPQFVVLRQLMMSERTGSPFGEAAKLTPLRVLLAREPVPLDTLDPTGQRLGLQLGWPILALAAVALLVTILFRRGRRTWPRTARLLGLTLLAAFMAWSPVDVWRFLPGPFQFVQFTYRLLLFAALFGSLLAAVGLALWFPKHLWRGALGTVAALAIVAGVGYMARPYLPEDKPIDVKRVQADADDPEQFCGLEDYQVSNAAAAGSSWWHKDLNMAGWQYGLLTGTLQSRRGVLLPAPASASGLLVEGTIRLPDGTSPEALRDAKLHVEVEGKTEELPLVPEQIQAEQRSSADSTQPRPFRVLVALDPSTALRSPVPVTVELLASDVALAERAVTLTGVRWQSPAAGPIDDRELFDAGKVASRVEQGATTVYRCFLDKPAVVQLPVLHYPKLLDVRDRGHKMRPANVGNLGHFLAVKLGPGPHELRVTFAGVRWANIASGVAWGGIALAIVWTRLIGRVTRRPLVIPNTVIPNAARDPGVESRRSTPGSLALLGMTGRGNLPVWRAALFAAAVLLGAAGPSIYAYAYDRAIHRGPQLSLVASASSTSRPELGAQNAVDGRLSTEWSASGGGSARLTLYPERRAKLDRITLESRGMELLESWHRVRVVVLFKGQKVLEREASFPDAATVRTHTIDLPATLADRVDLYFSEPVLQTTGGRPIPAEVVNPGYREIRLRWAKD
jgi:hypothetical protein